MIPAGPSPTALSSAVLPFLLFAFTPAQSIGLPKSEELCQKRCTSGIALRYAYSPINHGTSNKETNQSLKPNIQTGYKKGGPIILVGLHKTSARPPGETRARYANSAKCCKRAHRPKTFNE